MHAHTPRLSLLSLLLALAGQPTLAQTSTNPAPTNPAPANPAPTDAPSLPRRASLGVGAPTGDAGIYVTSVRAGSAASRMGIVLGDRILSLNNVPLATTPDLIAALRTTPGNTDATVQVARGDTTLTLQGKLDEAASETLEGALVEYGAVRVQPQAGEPYLLRTITTTPTQTESGNIEPGTRLPVFVYVQGITCSSIDRATATSAPDTRLVHAMAKAGFITLRVDKAGLGDSQGPACEALSFRDELEGYVQAIKAAKLRADVDPQRVYVFGHSMGGVMAPLIAKQTPLRGAIVYGTLGKTWLEYTLENTRRQTRLFGQSEAQVTDSVLMTSMFMAPLLIDKLTPQQLWERNPTLKAAMGDPEAQGITSRTISGRDATFYHELQDVNIAEAWNQARTNLLALHGEFDWVSSEEDHQTIADIVARSGNFAGEMRSLSFADHGLTSHLTLESSLQQMGQGEQLLELPQIIREWIASVEGEPRPTPKPTPSDTPTQASPNAPEDSSDASSQSIARAPATLSPTAPVDASTPNPLSPDTVHPGDAWAAFATGIWEGEVTTKLQGSDTTQTFTMRLEISRTESTGTYDWLVTFDGAAGRQLRTYTLRVASDDGSIVIDENNGVVLPCSLIGDTLHCTFEIAGAHIAASYELVGPATNYARMGFTLLASTPLDTTPSAPEHNIKAWKPLSIQQGDLLPVSR
jgi:hypothetical protein